MHPTLNAAAAAVIHRLGSLAFLILSAIAAALSAHTAQAAEPCEAISEAEKKEYLGLGEQANSHWANKDYIAAIQALVQAMDICDEDPRVQFNLARAYQKANNCNQALFWYERILSIDPNSPLGQTVASERERAGRYVTELQVECSNSARITVDCSDPGVRLAIGDSISNVKCPYSHRLESGTYKLRADLEGHEPYIVSINLVAGENNRILIPALEKQEAAPTTGTLRLNCEAPMTQVSLRTATSNQIKACNDKYDLPPGRYTIGLPGTEETLETIDIAIGETVAISVRPPVAKIERSGALIGIRANPSMGFASGTLYDKNAENSIGQELDGVQPSLPTFAILMELGYTFNDQFATAVQARFDVTNLSVMASALFRWVPWTNDVLSARLDFGVGGGSIVLPVQISEDERPLAKSGPVFGQFGAGISWRFNPLLSLVSMLETRVGFPDLSIPIDLSIGIEVQF